jgi:hypothetical protein
MVVCFRSGHSSLAVRHDGQQIETECPILSHVSEQVKNANDRFLEIIRARWGKVAHITFLFFGLGTNIIVSSG